MVAIPGFTPDMIPEVKPADAIEGLLLVHVPPVTPSVKVVA